MLACLKEAERLSVSKEVIVKRVGMARKVYTETQESLATIKGDKKAVQEQIQHEKECHAIGR